MKSPAGCPIMFGVERVWLTEYFAVASVSICGPYVRPGAFSGEVAKCFVGFAGARGGSEFIKGRVVCVNSPLLKRVDVGVRRRP